MKALLVIALIVAGISCAKADWSPSSTGASVEPSDNGKCNPGTARCSMMNNCVHEGNNCVACPQDYTYAFGACYRCPQGLLARVTDAHKVWVWFLLLCAGDWDWRLASRLSIRS
jgi:hypothetical protein